MSFRQVATQLPGLMRLAPSLHGDARGYLVETYRRDALEQLGITDDFVQDNHSRSAYRTIRGLHFQAGSGQAKLVRVARGAILDVVVDIRRGSPTFGKHEAVPLDDVQCHVLYVPVGYAHGFAVLSEVADVCYRVSGYYDAGAERGVRWDDPAVGIPWPFDDPIISERDRTLPGLESVR